MNVGFVIYKSMKTVATESILYVRAKKKRSTLNKEAAQKRGADHPIPAPKTMKVSQASLLANEDPATALLNIATTAIVPGMINIILCLGPFAAFQWYSYTTFCRLAFLFPISFTTTLKVRLLMSYSLLPRLSSSDVQFPPAIIKAADKQGYILPGGDRGENISTWCDSDPPMAYPYVQAKYWNVGFLNYWEVKQAPNFLLAAPCIGKSRSQKKVTLLVRVFSYDPRIGEGL